MSSNLFTIYQQNPNIKDGLVKNYLGNKTQGSFFDLHENGRPINLLVQKRQISLLFLSFLFLFFCLLTRTFYLQIPRGNYYLSLAEGNRTRQVRQKANRGVIYDRELAPLLKNEPNFSLVLSPQDLPRDEVTLKKYSIKLSPRIDIPESTLFQILLSEQKQQNYENIIIKDDIPYEQAIKLLVELENYSGLDISKTDRRKYLGDLSFSHLLGYLGKINEQEWPEYKTKGYSFIDTVGKSGLEKFYETTLRGVDGRKEMEVDSTGKIKKIINETATQHGNDIVLTINAELQEHLSTTLEKNIQLSNAKSGVAIILDPSNGDILSLVSFPYFDNNLFAKGIPAKDYEELINNENQPLFNRTISGEYPPGSTFKLIVASAALQEKVVTKYTGFNSIGGLQIDQWFFPDWKAGGHGYTQITKALAQSVNTFFYYVGGGYEDFDGLGVDKITDYATQFGLGEKTGIDLPGEQSGFLPSKEWKVKTKNERWYVGDTYHLAIGQGDVLVTPLQVAMYTSVFANQGTLYQPHLIKQIRDNYGNVLGDYQPKVLNKNFIQPEYIDTVRQGLREAVTYGSASRLSNLNITSAAKTGTAQVGGDKKPHAWFTAFAPYENPEIVITVLIENGGEGSDTALPVAQEMINYYFNVLDKNKQPSS